MTKWTWVLGLFGALLAGCGGPFGPCYSELVEGRFSGTVDGATTAGAGQVAPGNTEQFPDLRAFLIDGAGLPGRRVVVTVEGVPAGGFLAIDLPGAVTQGQAIPVAGVFQGGGWGVMAGSSGGATVSVRFGSGYGVSGSGQLTVLATAPLRIRIVLDVGDGAGATHAIRGDVAFSFRRDRTACS